MMAFTIEFQGLEEAVESMRNDVDTAAREALARGALQIASEAKSGHTFTNRTGRLERSIHANQPRGSLSRNTLSVEVVANTSYAIYVEEVTGDGAWAYLRPAFERMKNEVERGVNDALTRAVQRAA